MNGTKHKQQQLTNHPQVGLAKTKNGRRVCWGFDPGVARGDIPAMIVAECHRDTITIVYCGPPVGTAGVSEILKKSR